MKAAQLKLPTFRDPFYVPPGKWANRSLVDAAFVARSVAVMRDMPDAEQRLRAAMEGSLQSIRDIDRVYGTEPNEWATATRERLWLEHFTTETILRQLEATPKRDDSRQTVEPDPVR